MKQKLESLAKAALKADLLAKEATQKAEEAKNEFIAALEAEDKYNPATSAVGNVRTKISPNRRFNANAAYESLPEDVQKLVLVEAPDAKLVKQHLTPIQLENFMESYPNKPFKISLEVLDD